MTRPGALELDDLTLARAQRGDEGACRRLVERHERAVFALLGRLVGPRGRRERVEDLAQETFLRVFRALARFDAAGPARLSTWILTIATRVGLDELERSDRALVPLDGAREVASGARADADVERRAVGRALERAVEELSPPFRAVFLLREVHELDYDEIARALEIDPGTVKSRLSRARSALREALKDVKP